MSKEKSTIGNNIRKYRKLAGISQDILSKKSDLAFHKLLKLKLALLPTLQLTQSKK